MIGRLIVIALLLGAGWWWMRRPRAPRASFGMMLDAAEARAILGVAPDADAAAIRAAHRRLIAAVHPDRGGSADLTRRINLARDTLLGRAGN